MKAPTSYLEWVTVLKELKKDAIDYDLIDIIRQGKIEWQSGVAERFTNRFVEVINFRMNLASDRFQKNMANNRTGEIGVSQSLILLRKELMYLIKVIESLPIPNDISRMYQDLVKDQAKKIQKSLEDSAKLDNSGKLLSIIKNNKVDIF